MTEKYSKHELVSPEWLNEQFIENILKNSEKDDKIKVLSLEITPASVNNDHYGSLMYRTKIKYNSSKGENIPLSLIVKTMPGVEGVKKEMLSNTFIFKTEIRMYSETLPKMEAILRKYGDNTVLGAKVYYSAMKPVETLVFEDLSEKGFATLRNRMPNEEETKRALMKLAKWHAVSYILAKEEPESITNYNDGTFTITMNRLEFFVNAIKSFINNVLTSDEELKTYIPLFEKLDKDEALLKRCVDTWKAYKRGDEALFVLNHGDFHFKNMMFRHKDSGELDELMLVDFQTCYYGPAVTDVMYSTYMVMDGDMRWNKREELIYYYFSIFTDSLKKFEFKGEIPKMADLQIDLIKYRALETFMLTAFLPFIAALNDETLELDKMVESPDYRLKMLSNPIVIAEAKRTLPKYLHKGHLE